MKKKLLLALLVGLVSTVSATETRLNGMGNPGILVKDNSEIFTFPGAIVNYSKEITVEMRQPNDVSSYTLGGNLPLGDNVLGIYLNNKLRGFGDRFSANSNIDGVELNNTIGFLYGINMSNMNLGFSLDMAFDKNNASYDNDDADIHTSSDASVTYVKLGAGASQDKFDVSLILDVPMMSDETTEFTTFGATVTGRYFLDTDMGTLVPAVILAFGSSTHKVTIGDNSAKLTATDIVADFSLGYNLSVTDASMLFAGVEALGVSMTSVEDDSYTNTVAPKFYLGVESQVKEWFAARFGGSKKYMILGATSEDDDATAKTSSSSAPFDVSLGATFSFGNFDLDANVDEALLFNGPNFITGNTSAFSADLALSYTFGQPKDVSTAAYEEAEYVPSTQPASITVIKNPVIEKKTINVLPEPTPAPEAVETEETTETSIVE